MKIRDLSHMRKVLSESRDILKLIGITNYTDDVRNLCLALNHPEVHSLKYAEEVLRRLKEAVALGGDDPAKVKANVIAAMKEIARILGDGVSLVTGKPLK